MFACYLHLVLVAALPPSALRTSGQWTELKYVFEATETDEIVQTAERDASLYLCLTISMLVRLYMKLSI